MLVVAGSANSLVSSGNQVAVVGPPLTICIHDTIP